MKKNILTLFIFLTAFLINFSSVFAHGDQHHKFVLFINQVRGTECCDSGSLKATQDQIKQFSSYKVPATFVLRYDGLIDPKFSNLFLTLPSEQFEIGAFLEITPQLLKDSGVVVQSTASDWYEAQNAYTIGYTSEERKKIIDTYMERFQSIFGYYPKTTTAWILDTPTLNYLKDTYGVMTHQITREQWGTDSYTLSGGPIHYPYLASRNWSFIPTAQPDDSSLLIVRQTGSDPLFNYGDATSAFTTQPNDYTNDGKDIQYFYKLRELLLSQKQNTYSFLLLGLENSMPEKFQTEYFKQLKNISEDHSVSVLTASNFNTTYSTEELDQKVTTLFGTDQVTATDNRVLWVTTKKYRARILITPTEILLTDYRLYSDQLIDPYTSYEAQKLGYWVSPFILDGSRFYSFSTKNTGVSNPTFKEKLIQTISAKILPELQQFNVEISPTKNDLSTQPESLLLSKKNSQEVKLTATQDLATLEFQTNDGTSASLVFQSDFFESVTTHSSIAVLHKNNPSLKIEKKYNKARLSLSKNETNYYSLQVSCVDGICKYTPEILDAHVFERAQQELYPYLFPEVIERELDTQMSVLYPHNRYAIADENPVRFVFIPKDTQGYATTTKIDAQVSVFPQDDIRVILHEQKANGTLFFDVNSPNVGEYTVTFTVADQMSREEKVYFAPNCKNELLYCLLHPRQAGWYTLSMLYVKLRSYQ